MLEALTVAETYGYLLVFARIGAALALLPGFSAEYVSVRIRLIFALALTFVVKPIVADALPIMPATVVGLALLIAAEITIGAFIAVIARIVVAALHIAGTFMAYFSSLANAMVHDTVADQQSATLAGFLGTLGLVLVFVTDLHHLMIRAVVMSYARFPPGMALPSGDIAEAVARAVAGSMVIGLQLSAPLLVVALVYNIGLGVIGRLMPQLPVFFFGLPLQISFQIWAIALTISGIMIIFINRFGDVLLPFATP
ncbi:MAG: flagellar biosynthetic protein FliR [Rhodospirillales bacterium]|nr:flagellar biosynthetic protein FliR [Rhodospirillales bacterium]